MWDARAKPLVSRVNACFRLPRIDAGGARLVRQEGGPEASVHLRESVLRAQFLTRLIACDAQQRLVEMCSSKVWGQMFAQAGFRRERLSSSMLDAAYEVVKCFSKDFGLTLADDSLGLTWQGRSLLLLRALCREVCPGFLLDWNPCLKSMYSTALATLRTHGVQGVSDSPRTPL